MQRKRQDKLQKETTKVKPYRVAVTGNAGSGKSLVCRRFERLGVPVVDLDILARKAVAPSEPALKKIVEYFGKTILNRNGTLDRKALRKKIIADEASRRALEKIVHPEIGRLMREQMERMDGDETPFVVLEVPLLFETGMQDAFDTVILVMAQGRLQAKRLSERDHISEKEANSLLKTQISDEKKIDRSDFVIINTESIRKLNVVVDKIFFILSRKY